jgi:hypothetical protein
VALVERMVFDLVGSRAPAVAHSVEVRLTTSTWTSSDWTNPLDVFLDPQQGAVEPYECKHGARGLDQGDLNQLQDVALSARDEGKQCRPTVATLDTAAAIRIVLSKLAIRGTVYFAHKDELLALADGPPFLNIS